MEENRDYFESENSESDVEMASENNMEENQGGNNQEVSENNNNEILKVKKTVEINLNLNIIKMNFKKKTY